MCGVVPHDGDGGGIERDGAPRVRKEKELVSGTRDEKKSPSRRSASFSDFPREKSPRQLSRAVSKAKDRER